MPHAAGNAVRLAIGACYVKLGEFEPARLTYDRVLKLDQTCAAALAGRAATELLAPERTSVATGVRLLNEAYALDPLAPGVCNALAACHLARGNLRAAEDLATHAVRFSFRI